MSVYESGFAKAVSPILRSRINQQTGKIASHSLIENWSIWSVMMDGSALTKDLDQINKNRSMCLCDIQDFQWAREILIKWVGLKERNWLKPYKNMLLQNQTVTA